MQVFTGVYTLYIYRSFPNSGGTFCELYACTQMNTQPNFNFGGRSMTFILSARNSMQDALNMISANVQIFTRDVQVRLFAPKSR